MRVTDSNGRVVVEAGRTKIAVIVLVASQLKAVACELFSIRCMTSARE